MTTSAKFRIENGKIVPIAYDGAQGPGTIAVTDFAPAQATDPTLYLPGVLAQFAAIPLPSIGGAFTISWAALMQAMQPGQPRAVAVLVAT